MGRISKTMSMALTLVFLMGNSSVQAADEQRKPLLAIMQNLATAMNDLNEAIFSEDYAAVSKSAKEISEHPQATAKELKAISKALGKEMSKFKKWDTQVHEGAVEIANAAGKKDMNEIVAKHHDVIKGCVGCHADFRTKIQKALRE